MLRLIHGENYYQSFLDLEQLRTQNKDKEISIVNGDVIQDVGDIFVNNESFGLFNSGNITIVKRFFRNSKKISLEKKIIEKLQKSDLTTLNLIFWEDTNIFAKSYKKSKTKTAAKKPRATSKLNTYLKNLAEVKQNDKLEIPQLTTWVKEEFMADKITISAQSINDLIARVGQNQALLASEINKLKLWAKANASLNITKEVVSEVTILYEQDYQTWDLTDAFFAKNKVKALTILDILLQNPQQDFPMVIGAVLRQLKTIFLIKKYSSQPSLIMSKLHLMPFLFGKAQRLASNFSIKDLKLIYQKFINLDYAIKLGKIDVKLGLDLLIITLS